MCKLSIIVPVYNTSTHLKKSINSILMQKLENVEVLTINDGSTDNSSVILKEYAKQNPEKITYYEKANAGVADTRNFGIQKAKGKYILFIDSDDYIKDGLIEELLQYIEEDIDIIKFKLERVDQEGNTIEKVDGPVFEKVDGETGFNILCFSDVLLDSPCVYAFKKELFVRKQFRI